MHPGYASAALELGDKTGWLPPGKYIEQRLRRIAEALQEIPDELEPALERLQTWLAESDRHHLLTLGDARFPSALLQIADPPVLLYVLGDLEALSHPNKLAIVGSRNPTHQGAANAHQFAQALGQAGLCIVSGLALGVDGAAHEGALAAGARTIAVVGTGLDRVYPKRHLNLAHRIAERGALVSEAELTLLRQIGELNVKDVAGYQEFLKFSDNL